MHIRLKLWKSGIMSVLRCYVYFSRVVNWLLYHICIFFRIHWRCFTI
jgi:hypothetical protein